MDCPPGSGNNQEAIPSRRPAPDRRDSVCFVFHYPRTDFPMPVKGLLGSEEESAAAGLVAEASRLLEAESYGVPKGFVGQLFGQAAADDVIAYTARELAQMARDAWALLQLRKPGAPKIQVGSLNAVEAGGRANAVSVVQIVNDNMPFLLDSVMAELNAQRLGIRLVVHPVLTLARDDSGRLTDFGNATEK